MGYHVEVGKCPMMPNNQKFKKYIYIKYTTKTGGGSARLASYSTGPPNIETPPKLEVCLNLHQNLHHFGSISTKYIQPPNNTPNKMEARV
jgi:hypothetical protein